MQPLLNASKVWQTILSGSLKKRELFKNIQKQIKSSNGSWQARN